MKNIEELKSWFEDDKLYVGEYVKHKIDQLDEPEVLSQEWTDEMLEPIEDPLVNKILERNNKQNVADEIIKLKEQGKSWLGISDQVNKKPLDPIKPSHYRKGEIDLYESWYRTYPFNEFRAGMQMISERYMKRDKNDRVEDLDKGIYTLERLKGYEKLEEEE